jgi:hypothetical protein
MPAPKEPQRDAAETPAAETSADDSSTEDEFVPMNRAERRAKGKSKQQQHLSVGKINPHGSGAGHAHKQYSNRRSGGGR